MIATLVHRRLTLSCIFIISVACFAQSDACSGPRRGTDGVSLTISFEDGRTTFQEGEIIPLKLAFTSTEPDQFVISTRMNDRSGMLRMEDFCLTPDTGQDPLRDFYAWGAFAGSFLSSGPANLTQEPYDVRLELNEFLSLRPGSYNLQIKSSRVSLANPPKGERTLASADVWSNEIQFEVLPADPHSQQASLQDALTVLDDKNADDAAKKRAAHTLRYMGSEASTRELVKRFTGLQQPLGWELNFGIFGSPHRQLAIAEMRQALDDPTHPVTPDFVRMLVKLEIESDPNLKLPPQQDQEAWASASRNRQIEYHKREAAYMARAADRIVSRPGSESASSALALLVQGGLGDQGMQEKLRAIVLARWKTLSVDEQNSAIDSYWPVLRDPAFIPILRQIVEGPANPQHIVRRPDRAAAITALTDISPQDGLEAIRREALAPKGDVRMNLLGLLPQSTDTAIEQAAFARLQKEPTALDFELFARYASATLLPQVKTIFERSKPELPCAAHAPLLQYFLRVAPAYGVDRVRLAFRTGASPGCVLRFKDLADFVDMPQIERLAIESLHDSDPDAVANAAEALGDYGSPRAQRALWQRMREFHEQWKDRTDELEYVPGMPMSPSFRWRNVANALMNAIMYGNAWLETPDRLRELKLLVPPDLAPQIDGTIDQLTRSELFLSIYSNNFSGVTTWTLGNYHGTGLQSLAKRCAHLPTGTKVQISPRLSPKILLDAAESAAREGARTSGAQVVDVE